VKCSVQTVALNGLVVSASEHGGLALADAYWAEIRRRTRGIVRVRRGAAGVEIRLARLTLFRFGAPRTVVDDGLVECSFPITGGLLAKEQGGFLTFVQRTAPQPELAVSVRDYVPFFSSGRERRSLRGFLYRVVQERAHAAISHGYLARMAARAR
jgi:hypothetical protein